jgi:hypothetical protein
MRLPRESFPAHVVAAASTLAFALGVLMAALFFAGCATMGSTLPRVGPRVGQEQAVHIAWVEVFGRTDRPPVIRWVEPSQQTCTDPNSGKGGFPQLNSKAEAICREGITLSPLECVASWHGELSIGETVADHEMWHVALLRMGIVDEDHARDDWRSVEECATPTASPTCGIVDRANRAVIEAGR